MPRARKKTGFRKKQHAKFNRGKSKVGRPSRALVPSTYFFTRHTTEVRSSLASASSGQWNTSGDETSWYQSFQLNDLNDETDYTNLFTSYRINAVQVTLIPQATQIAQATGSTASLFSQLMVYVVPNAFGRYSTSANITEEIALDTQAVKIRRWIQGKSLKLYTKLNQLSAIYNSPTNDYVKIRPKFVSTDETDTPHYGMSLLFVNQNGGGLPEVPVKIITKYFMEFKGAK